VSYRSYPSIYNLGHRVVRDIFTGVVLVEEKIDGSQFSFGVLDGELVCASKRKQLIIDYPDKLFTQAVETAKRLAPYLRPGWIYRSEFLAKPKHNVLAYNRTPEQHLMIYDISCGEEDYVGPRMKHEEAMRLGLECVPELKWVGQEMTANNLRELLGVESCLGGPKMEGVVIKNYGMFGPDKKVLMAKFVSEEFKEKHASEWKVANPKAGDIVYALVSALRTDRRWEKAIEHLRDDGVLTDSPRDIGNLLKEIGADIEKECEDEIKDALYKWALPKILRGVRAGFPEFYKQRLLDQQFQVADETTG
jgi:ATP-dependent RNA circularization protein (DNA/RNA ligase family)